MLETLETTAERYCEQAGIASGERLVRFVEFGAVGASGALVNMTVFLASIHLGVWYLAAGTAAFLAAVTHNFSGNYLVTFDRPDGRLLYQYGQFVAVSLGGYVVYSLALALWIGALDLDPLLGNLLAIAPAGLWNFLGADEFAFDADATLSTKAASSANRAVHLLYRGRLKAAIRGTVVYSVAYGAYARALNVLTPTAYEYTVDGASATVRTDTGPKAVSLMHSIRKEDPVMEAFAEHVQPGDVVWDVGANLGLYALLAADHNATAVAIEPVPANASEIATNASLSDVAENVTVVEAALDSTTGRAEMAIERLEPGTQTPKLGSHGNEKTVTVPVVKGDALECTPPDVVKLDVEGHELAALEGLSQTLDSVREIYVEAHDQDDADHIRQQLYESGFRVETLHSYRGETHLRGYQSRP